MELSRNSDGSELLTHNQAAMQTKLTTELHRLNGHRFVKIHNSLWRLVMFQFLRGLAFGLGSVLGATLLFSALLWWLAQVETLPVIGEWLGQLADQIEFERSR